MSLIPAGVPAHSRAAGYEFYGGNANKRNHLQQGVIDPETDVGAEELMRLTADLAAVARCAPFCSIAYTCRDTSPAAPTVSSIYQMTGVNIAGFEGDSPPSGFATLSRNGAGDITITFAGTYADDYAVVGAFVPRMASASLQGTTAGHATAVISGSTVRVRAFNAAGTALSDAVVAVQVW